MGWPWMSIWGYSRCVKNIKQEFKNRKCHAQCAQCLCLQWQRDIDWLLLELYEHFQYYDEMTLGFSTIVQYLAGSDHLSISSLIMIQSFFLAAPSWFRNCLEATHIWNCGHRKKEIVLVLLQSWEIIARFGISEIFGALSSDLIPKTESEIYWFEVQTHHCCSQGFISHRT